MSVSALYFAALKWMHYKTQGLFFSPCRIPFTCIYRLLSAAVTIETNHPYQQVAFGCRAHWISQERDTGEPVFPWLDFGTSVVRKAFAWLWQCFLGSWRHTNSGTSTHFVTMGWQPRQSEISWEKSTPVIEMSSPGRQLLCGACYLSTVHAFQSACSRYNMMPEQVFHWWRHSVEVERDASGISAVWPL